MVFYVCQAQSKCSKASSTAIPVSIDLLYCYRRMTKKNERNNSNSVGSVCVCFFVHLSKYIDSLGCANIDEIYCHFIAVHLIIFCLILISPSSTTIPIHMYCTYAIHIHSTGQHIVLLPKPNYPSLDYFSASQTQFIFWISPNSIIICNSHCHLITLYK